jgi:HEPN domain-containing protein
MVSGRADFLSINNLVWLPGSIRGLERVAVQPVPVNSPDEWLDLCRRYRDDAQALQKAKRPDGAWLNAGFAVECCLKAAIMKKERLNRWPEPDRAPELWTHDLRALFKRLGIDPQKFDTKHQVAPALKTVLDWRREHGYSVGKLPLKYANNLCEAAFA